MHSKTNEQMDRRGRSIAAECDNVEALLDELRALLASGHYEQVARRADNGEATFRRIKELVVGE